MCRDANTFHTIKSFCRKVRVRLWDFEVRYMGGCDLASSWYQRIERRVPEYTLPDPFRMVQGDRVLRATDWFRARRPELIELFKRTMYGFCPENPIPVQVETVSESRDALNGAAIKKEVRIFLGDRPRQPVLLLLYLPKKSRPAPLFLGLNFLGNHTLSTDPEITITPAWIPNNSITRGLPPDELRGAQSGSWPLGTLINRGYGLATAYCGDIFPDQPSSLHTGMFQKDYDWPPSVNHAEKWGGISAWAWGVSRIMDYLTTDPSIDSQKVILIGHSRLGKVALWAGAQDERFSAVISNQSGSCGAALSRRRFFESTASLVAARPHWFCEKFRDLSQDPDRLPVDQHLLVSLIAPRPVYIGSAQLDLNADPHGEFLCACAASEVYNFLELKGLPTKALPGVNQPVIGTIGYHMRQGAHGISASDWRCYLEFADRHMHRSATNTHESN